MVRILVFILGLLSFTAQAQWNKPYADVSGNVRYAPFTNSPKSLDPAKAYSVDAVEFVAQIYEPPLQYRYLPNVYELEPLTATTLPIITYYDAKNRPLPANTDLHNVAYTTYDIYLMPRIYYQPHPAFAKNEMGHPLYLEMTPSQLSSIHSIDDFTQVGTRELTAEDYVYEIKRLASPRVQSPIFSFMSRYIMGMSDYRNLLEKAWVQQNGQGFLDLRNYPLSGVKVIDRYHYQIKINGVYPPFNYWLAMPFFSPIPWEADMFYSQPDMVEHTIGFDWNPVGTGPYELVENNPNQRMVLQRNPYYHRENAPGPFIDKAVFILDKESIPRWNKFLQGYYDKSGVGSDNFDQAITIDQKGNPVLTPELQKQGIRLSTTVSPAIYYMGFNMMDPVVGGYSEQQQKLRQAISIALNYEEYTAIFLNGRGIPAQGPIPPGISGYGTGPNSINPYVYNWISGKPQRKSLEEAKRLLAEAGYPEGVDPKTGRALILNYDVATLGNPDDKAQMDWFRKQFSKLGIHLNIRATLYNRFKDTVRSGNAQIFSWGWIADYPDPENFLFLLYGPNGQVKYGGENNANYDNPQVNALFDQMRYLPEGAQRRTKVQEILTLVRKDAPWIFGFYPIDFSLSHQWNSLERPNAMLNNALKYQKINPNLRSALQMAWNHPIMTPIWILLALVMVLFLILLASYWVRQHRSSIERFKEL